jgi:hypothetical protein
MRRQRAAEYRAKNRSRQTRLRKDRKALGQRQVSVWLDEASLIRLKRYQKTFGWTQAEVVSDGLRALEMVERKAKAEIEAKKKTQKD